MSGIAKSTYIQEPPFFENFSMTPGSIAPITGARALGIFGDSVTTDHISPAGAIKKSSPAGKFLQENGVEAGGLQQLRLAARQRPHHDARHVRQRPHQEPDARRRRRWQHARTRRRRRPPSTMPPSRIKQAGTPLIVIAGQEYGTGSSRDWAAKGTNLLGVKVVVAQSFERIHRSNLVGMGVLPLQFKDGTTAQTLKLDGTETYDVIGLDANIKPQQDLTLKITRKDGSVENVSVRCRIDTPIEIDYYQHGGILPYVLRQLVAKA